MFPRLGLTCAALLVFAACGGGDQAVSTTLPLPPETLVTLPAESTEVEPVESTSPTTTSTSSTTTTTTTTVPVGEMSDLAAAIQRDLQAGEDALLKILGEPASQTSRDLAEKHFFGPALEGVLAQMDQLVVDGLLVMPNPETRSLLVATSEPILIGEPDGTAVDVETCRIDAGIIFEPPAQAGGPVVIVDDRVVRSTGLTHLRLVDDVWQLGGGELHEETVGATTCAA